MIYSQLYLKNKIKVPAFAVFLLITFVLLVFLRIFSRIAKPSKAIEGKLKRTEITNITSSSITVFWQSQEKEVGWIIYGESPKKLNKIVFDDRDLSSKKNPYFNHYVTIRNLKEKKKYFFSIVSGNKIINKQRNIPFNFITVSNNEIPKNLRPAYGRVVGVNNQPLEGAVVILIIEKKVIASSLTKSTGEWLIPFDYSHLNSSSKIVVEIINEDGKNSIINTNLEKISPLPQTVVIGKNYDFNQEVNVLSASSNMEEKNKIDIIYPKEKAVIPGRIPLIKGMALPNTVILISIKSSKTYSAQVKTDAKGFWSFLPPEPLSLGEHTITMIAKDKEGKDIVVERRFTVIGKEGSDAAVLGEATPSATVTFYPQSPTPTSASVFTPTPSLPVSGKNFILPILIGGSFIILGIGTLLAF